MSTEALAAHVHDAWWVEKKAQGFHSPSECQSSNRKSFDSARYRDQERFEDHFDPKTYKWCDKCHPDMYPYEELPENVKDYDRVTVKTVLDAIQANGMPGSTSDGYHTFDELYEYRKVYNALLFNEWAKQGLFEVHKSYRHGDGEMCFGGDWFIVMATLPSGQISNHYPAEDWDLFQVPERDRADEWDGHTPMEALGRMQSILEVHTDTNGGLKSSEA